MRLIFVFTIITCLVNAQPYDPSKAIIITQNAAEKINSIQIKDDDTKRQELLYLILKDILKRASKLPDNEAKELLNSKYTISIRKELSQITKKNIKSINSVLLSESDGSKVP